MPWAYIAAFVSSMAHFLGFGQVNHNWNDAIVTKYHKVHRGKHFA